MIRVEVTNEIENAAINVARLRDGVRTVCERHQVSAAEIGLAIVDDAKIHALNRQFLDHDYPTDVLSFPLSCEEGKLEGEIVVSYDTAAAQSARFGWSLEDELLLYAVHGALHLVGFDDIDDKAAVTMRAAEAEVLAVFGLEPHFEVPSEDPCAAASVARLDANKVEETL